MKQREFLLGESINGWYIKELGTKDFEPTTFIDKGCLKVREVNPELDAAYEECERALKLIIEIPPYPPDSDEFIAVEAAERSIQLLKKLRE